MAAMAITARRNRAVFAFALADLKPRLIQQAPLKPQPHDFWSPLPSGEG